MHIVITVNSAWNIWNFRKPLVTALLADGHRITVLAPPDDSVGDLERLGCRFIALSMSVQGLNPLDDLKLVKHFKDVFRRERPDLVLGFTIKNNIFGAMAAKSSGVAFIPTVTGLGTAFLSGAVLKAVAASLCRRAFRFLPCVFFQNIDDRDLFLKYGIVSQKQSRILPGSGIDLDTFSPAKMPSSKHPPIFLMIARILRDKGVLEFVAAARHVKKSHPAARFQLLGSTQSENRTAISSEMVQSWVDAGVLEYLGTASDVRPFIAASNCIILPSYREGAPRTLIEAAAMARPVIATDVPGCRAVVDSEVTGFLCEVRNAMSLATAIFRFLDLSAEKRMDMGREGRKKMKREFDQAIVVEAYRDAIRTLRAKR